MKKSVCLQFLGFIIFIIAAVGIIGFIGFRINKVYKEEQEYLQSDEYKQILEVQEKCKHDYVTVSDGIGRTLEVYSKCIKCGKEIR